MSFLTMGLNALSQCLSILNKVKKACQWIAKKLRFIKFEWLAKKFDKLEEWFGKLQTLAKFKKMDNAQKLKYLEDLQKSKNLTELKFLEGNVKSITVLRDLKLAGKLLDKAPKIAIYRQCLSSLSQVVVSTAKNIAESTIKNQIMNKIVTPNLNKLLSGLRLQI